MNTIPHWLHNAPFASASAASAANYSELHQMQVLVRLDDCCSCSTNLRLAQYFGSQREPAEAAHVPQSRSRESSQVRVSPHCHY